MRNDLGRVAKVGSVEVSKLFDVESYAAVHQLVSTVTAELEDNLTWTDALQAAFPGGSMTGAPKIRAMQIIAALEEVPRGLYSGAIGWVGVDGACEFAMTIRSIVLQAGLAKIGVGGGITIDSDAAEELEETRLKAKVLLQALNASDPWA
jgi:anthranilate/para-aminobenzoate synthase component I